MNHIKSFYNYTWNVWYWQKTIVQKINTNENSVLRLNCSKTNGGGCMATPLSFRITGVVYKFRPNQSWEFTRRSRVWVMYTSNVAVMFDIMRIIHFKSFSLSTALLLFGSAWKLLDKVTCDVVTSQLLIIKTYS